MKQTAGIIPFGAIFVLYVIFASACGLANRQVIINVREDRVNEVITSAALPNNVPFWVTGIDMQDGYMRVFVNYRKPDGTELSGAYDITMTAQDGSLNADILNVDMGGLALEPQVLDQIAELIAQDFILSNVNLGGQADVQSIRFSDGMLTMVVQLSP